MTRSEAKRNSGHAWTYSLILTLTLPWICFIQNNDFKTDQILKEIIETWEVTNRLWNGKMIKNDQCWKRTQFYGLRTNWKRMQIKSYDDLNYRNSNHLTFVLSKKGNNRKNESILEFQLKLAKWYRKNANSRSHLHKINEEIRQKLGHHTSHSLMQVPAKSSRLLQSFRTKSMINTLK